MIFHFSQLALVQTHQVKDELEKKYPSAKFEVVDMSTKGDEVLDRALYKIGDKIRRVRCNRNLQKTGVGKSEALGYRRFVGAAVAAPQKGSH